jgi:hypothetical protein
MAGVIEIAEEVVARGPATDPYNRGRTPKIGWAAAGAVLGQGQARGGATRPTARRAREGTHRLRPRPDLGETAARRLGRGTDRRSASARVTNGAPCLGLALAAGGALWASSAPPRALLA